MENAWLTSLLAGMFSSLIVGVIMAVFQKGMSKSVADAKDANDLRFKILDDKVETGNKTLELVHAKVEHVDEKVNSLTFKAAVSETNQKHILKDVGDLKDSIKDVVRSEHFGRVIKK